MREIVRAEQALILFCAKFWHDLGLAYNVMYLEARANSPTQIRSQCARCAHRSQSGSPRRRSQKHTQTVSMAIDEPKKLRSELRKPDDYHPPEAPLVKRPYPCFEARSEQSGSFGSRCQIKCCKVGIRRIRERGSILLSDL